MLRTGNQLLFIFSLVAILLPLVPIAMLLVRESIGRPRNIPLIILCFIAFIRQILLTAITPTLADSQFINAVFNIAELIVLALLYQTVLRRKHIKQGLSLLLAVILSTIITMYALEGLAVWGYSIELFLSAFMLLISLVAIYSVIADERSFILHSPVFWIASGTLCYHFIFLLGEGLKNYQLPSANTETERFILLAAVYMTRYVFYIVAAYFSAEEENKEEISDIY